MPRCQLLKTDYAGLFPDGCAGFIIMFIKEIDADYDGSDLIRNELTEKMLE